MTRPRLIVFARAPRLGAVKSRIASVAGEGRALAVHRELLATTLARLAPGPGAPPCARELCIAGDGEPGECERLAAQHGFELARQPGGDLGERMAAVLSQALERGWLPVLVGSDCPELAAGDVADAFAALRTRDAVLAPADDGGYALVGLRRPLPAMFEGIEWGTARVLEQTRQRLAQAGASWHDLRSVADVDTWEHYRRWRERAS